MSERTRISNLKSWNDMLHTSCELEKFNGGEIRVCCGGGCMASGSESVLKFLKEEVSRRAMNIRVLQTGCLGPCARGPVAAFSRGITCTENKESRSQAAPLVFEGLNQKLVSEILDDWDYTSSLPVMKNHPAIWNDAAGFFREQKKIALRSCGLTDPDRIESAIANGAYSALVKLLLETPADERSSSVLSDLKESGLRGRGGAGFPTWRKWEAALNQSGYPKYVICNADEGDPGAFMDRSILEGAAHDLIEGMLIAGLTTGSDAGFIYVRAEYPLAVERLNRAIQQAKELGLIGTHILGSNFSFNLEIRKGSGAFVCGEETALMNSIEGRRGEPRPRPPFPAEKGLWDCPSLLNNVETYASVPCIVGMGAASYLELVHGSSLPQGSRGTKVFALAGSIRNSGLVEVPIGTRLGEIIYDIGGGIIGDKPFKAAQIGGPSGGCVPREYLDVSLDYESLSDLGAIMGSGGLIVMDEETCMVDVARFFLEFVQEESCGKCAPCRVGTKRMLEILERICEGQGCMQDLETLERLGKQIQETALCGLGQTAPNPVLSTLRHFRHEYEQHILSHHCAAGVCPGLVRAPCQSACPAGVDVPGFVALVKEQRYADALKLHRERNPFAAVCARVCFHTCEEHCRRSSIDSPVAIRAVKRFMVDQEVTIQHPEVLLNPRNAERKIAIIGAGPAGLSCAYFLARLGYTPRVYEAEERPGGMLVQTIPAYRLPREVLAREIRMIEQLGVEIITGKRLGQDFSLSSLREEAYEAVFLGIGAPGSTRLGIPGEDLEGVDHAVDFLRQYNIRGSAPVAKELVIIGGGNAAVDAARTAVRLGAEKVTIVYRRTRGQMPAYAEELDAAEEEGIVIRGLMQPVALLADDRGRVRAVRCMPMELGGFDRSGRRRPTDAGRSAIEISCAQVIAAVGQQPPERSLYDSRIADALLDDQGYIKVDPASGLSGLDWLFAGGDCVTGPASVVAAIGAGERAAVGIDRYFTGENHAFWRVDREVDVAFDPDAAPVKQGREALKTLDVRRRMNSFEEVELPWHESVALMQAARCLRCEYGKCRSDAASREAVYV